MSERYNQETTNKGLTAELDRIKKLQELDEPQSSDDYREPLSIEVKHELKVLLSWGGGEDGFKLYFSKEWELLGGVYYQADWGEYYETGLTPEEAEEVFSFYLYGDVSAWKEC
jgi:hypothetical protein